MNRYGFDTGGSFPWCVVVVAFLVWGVVGCQSHEEPGADLTDAAPPAKLGPEIDTATRRNVEPETGADISGEFDLVVRAQSPRGEILEIPFVAVVDQSGDFESGGTTLEFELRSPRQPGEPGTEADNPVEVDEEGKFTAVVDGYELSADTFEELAADNEARVTLDSQIVDDNCFQGDATIVMRDVEIEQAPEPIPEIELQGPFDAGRVETSNPCGGGSSGTDTSIVTDADGGKDG